MQWKTSLNKYKIHEKIFLYFSITVFLIFILLPFVEMFYASLRPLDHLFRSPYQFYSDDLSFWAYREMWNTVPMLPRYIFNSFFLATTTSLITLLFVIPAAYSYARFNFPFKQGSLWVLLAVNMFSGAVLLIPLFKLYIVSIHNPNLLKLIRIQPIVDIFFLKLLF